MLQQKPVHLCCQPQGTLSLWQEGPVLAHWKSTLLPCLPLSVVILWGSWASASIYISVSLISNTLWLWAVLWSPEVASLLASLPRGPMPSHSPASCNRPEHTQQSKQEFHHTPDSRDKHHMCPMVTDTDGKIPSSSWVTWLLYILTKEVKIKQLQHEHSLDPVYHCLLAMQHQHNSHMSIFATENIRK